MLAVKGGMAVRGVPRKPTMAGGFEIDLTAMPAKPSGRTGASGELLKPEMADAEQEAKRLVFENQHSLATLSEEFFAGRYVVTDERIRALMMRLDDLRKYVQVLASRSLVPFQCSRCQAQKTHDPKGDAMCPSCVDASYGRPKVR